MMKLPAERCIEAIASPVKRMLLKRNGKQVQRRYPRFPIAMPGMYAYQGVSFDRRTCELLDVSAAGMALRLSAEHPPPPCSILSIVLHAPSVADAVTVMLKVKWSRAADTEMSGAYMAGGTCVWDNDRIHQRLLEYAYTSWFRRAT